MNTLPETTSRQRGRWLVVLRGVWIASAVTAFGILIASIPGHLAQSPLGNLRNDLVFDPTPLGLAVFRLAMLVSFLSALLSLGLAVFLYVKKPDDRMALFLSFYLLAHGILFAGPIEKLDPYWQDASRVNSFVLLPLLLGPGVTALVSLFPDGRFVPRWSRWLVPAAILLTPVSSLGFSGSPGDTYPISGVLFGLMVVISAVFFGVLLYIPVYRYRHVSTPEQRQQTKWVVFGIVMMFLFLVVSGIPWNLALTLPPGASIPIWLPFGTLIWTLATTIIPGTLTIAVMRYRLYEIDVLINRSLVYGLMTGTLALIYSGSVVVLQALFRSLTGQESPIPIVASTLMIAALFNPLRRRVQDGIDRRFYRQRYDAEQILAQFSARIRDEVDISELSNALLVAVEEAIQSERTSLWLFDPQAEYLNKVSSRASNSG